MLVWFKFNKKKYNKLPYSFLMSIHYYIYIILYKLDLYKLFINNIYLHWL